MKGQRIVNFCHDAMYWLIVAIPFAASFSSAVVDGCVSALITFFMVQQLWQREKNMMGHPALVLFFLFFVVALLSFINTVHVGMSMKGMLKLLKHGLILLIVFHEVRDAKHIQRILVAMAAGLVLVSLDGIYQFIFGVDLLRQNPYTSSIGLKRISATFSHTNLFAGYLVVVLSTLIPVTLYYLKGFKRNMGVAMLALGAVCLVLTFCRSAALGMVLVLFMMIAVRRDKVLLACVLVLAGIAPFMMPGQIKSWSKTTHSWQELFLGKDRPIIFETAWNMIGQHPLVGVGVNTFVLNYPRYKLREAILDPGNEDMAGASWYAHNSYLHMTAETGIISFFIFLFLILVLAREAIKFYMLSSDLFFQLCCLGVAMSLAAFLIHGLTETNLYNPKIAILFWYQIAFLMAVVRIGSTKGEARVEPSDERV